MSLLNSLQQTPRNCRMLEDLISTSKSLLQSEFGIMNFRTSFISQFSLFLFVFRVTMIDHLDIISTTVHKESQEAKSQNSSTTSTLRIAANILTRESIISVLAIAAIAKKAVGLSNKSKKKKG